MKPQLGVSPAAPAPIDQQGVPLEERMNKLNQSLNNENLSTSYRVGRACGSRARARSCHRHPELAEGRSTRPRSPDPHVKRIIREMEGTNQ
jgi:hypothetical protein